MQDFCHLHTHTQYSLLDGLASPERLVKKAKEMGQSSLAITDHGNVHGLVEFYNACRKHGVKPILGMEGYMAIRTMSDRLEQDRKRHHLLLLAENLVGYHNLLNLSSVSYLDGFYYKPRIDWSVLEKYNAGLIATTGCLASNVNRAIVAGDDYLASSLIDRYVDIFGGRFYIELQDHGIPDLTTVNRWFLANNKRWGLPYVATNDVHYATPDDPPLHDALLCVQTHSRLTDTNRMRFPSNQFWLKSRGEMESLFGHIPGAVDNTLVVAERCSVELPYNGYTMPRFEAGGDSGVLLRSLCGKEFPAKYPNNQTAKDRLEYELSVIIGMGFADYFLILNDFCQYAKQRDIWWNVRGSAAGSLVAYVLGITSLDPLENHLLFERFLNPNRVSMPDVDFDWPTERRGEMIDYLIQRWGADKVAGIATFGTMGARATIRDVGRVMGVPLGRVDSVAKSVSAIPGKPVTIAEAMTQGHEFYSQTLVDMVNSDTTIGELVGVSQQLEGTTRHSGVHPAGIVITDKPILEYLPVFTSPKSSSSIGKITQWDMSTLDELGFLKVDFLGLRSLSVLRMACDLIAQRHGITANLDNIPYNYDHKPLSDLYPANKLFEIYQSGDTDGVFQVEGAGMTKVLMKMQPTQFKHIVAAIALFRPGPIQYLETYIHRLHGVELVDYHHPDLAEILADTYGIIIYQEQIMRVAVKIAGYTPGEADDIRKAVGKKLLEKIAKHRQKFIQGSVSNGYSCDLGEKIWADIETFARYGFNLSHATNYAKLSCQTAYIKRHFPLEYLAAMLTLEADPDKLARYLSNAKRNDFITILPPHINKSGRGFTIEGNCLRFGFSSIKNVGEEVVTHILAHRQPEYLGMTDLLNKVNIPTSVRKTAFESMIDAGCFDCWGRRKDWHIHLPAISQSSRLSTPVTGQPTLFAMAAIRYPWDGLRPQSFIGDMQTLRREKAVVGVYISNHPTVIHKNRQGHRICHIVDVDDTVGAKVCGLVLSTKEVETKSGKKMAFATIEDDTGIIDVVLFPNIWGKFTIVSDQIHYFTGYGQMRDGKTSLIIQEVGNV